MGSLTTLSTEVKEGWTIGNVLVRQAEERPDSPALQWQTEEPFTYKELYEHCLRLAGGLRELGVEAGDKVLIMQPNSLEIILTWFGTNLLGAVEVPINAEYKSSWLTHEANDCEASLAVVHEEYLSRFSEVADELEHLQEIVVVGESDSETREELEKNFKVHTWGDLENAEAISEPAETHYYDTMGILYTSGTTGPSKGVVLPYGVCGIFSQAVIDSAELTSDDVNFVVHPVFHGNAQFMQILPTLRVGGRVSIWPGFSASKWLEQVRESEATITNTIGVLVQYIYSQDEGEDDADNPLRVVLTQPTPSDIGEDFEKRFGVKCLEGYGMTEIGVVTYRRLDDPLVLGTAGKPLDEWFEVKVIDPESGETLGPDELGEIVVRPKTNGIIMKEYQNQPEKTLEAWRDLWFHTDDAGRMDEEGYLTFEDRADDVLRVGGENISSYSIESVANEHESIEETAAIAVPADYEGAEDEVLLYVVLEEGEELDPEELHEHCNQGMPHFAVPRYIEFIEEIPKTANGKVKKKDLREQGVTENTWDREEAGVEVQK